MVAMCIKMGWDYFTFISQPTWFVESIDLYWKLEYEETRKQMRKISKKTR